MNVQQRVPMVDLGWQHARIEDEVRAGFDDVLSQRSYILGPAVAGFEKEFAEYSAVKHVIGVGNGTDAIELALRGAGIGPGDKVMLPANTFVATAGAVARTGASIVLADCDDDFLISVEDVERRATQDIKALVAVHLYGQTAPVDRLREVLGTATIVVEDAAQAQGARRYGVAAGGLGDVAATSFYPGKNLGAYGDAGAVLTSSDQLADRIRSMRNHGGLRKYEHLEVGVNSRMDSLQAVVLSAKLRKLDDWNQCRRDAALLYGELLADLDEVVLPRAVEGNEHIYHLYVVRVPHRDRVVAELNGAGIEAGIHYPLPIHRLPAYKWLGLGEGTFPKAEELAGEIMSLPIYPGITRSQQEYVADRLHAALRPAARAA